MIESSRGDSYPGEGIGFGLRVLAVLRQKAIPMRIWKIVLLTILILISLAAGVPKLLQQSQELAFLAHIGLGPVGVTVVGVVQFLAGILLVPKSTRLFGALMAILALAVSAIALVTAGNMTLGLATMVPIAIGIAVAVDSHWRRNKLAPVQSD